MRKLALILTASLALATPALARDTSSMDDAKIKKAIIAQSIASYSGSCPCPYNTTRNGSSCGGRSAYSRKGGAAPLCYPRDVTAQQVEAYRQAQR